MLNFPICLAPEIITEDNEGLGGMIMKMLNTNPLLRPLSSTVKSDLEIIRKHNKVKKYDKYAISKHYEKISFTTIIPPV